MPIAAIRVAEIRRVYKDRYGETLPDDDAGREDARILAHHLAQLRDPHRKVTSTLDTLAPWMRPDEVEAVLAKPFRYGADKLAQRLNLTEADRRRLKVKTIGAVDMTREERKAASKRRKRAAEEQKRRKQGVKPRAAYLAESTERAKPWEAEGISRATWYRRRTVSNAAPMRQVCDPHIPCVYVGRRPVSPKPQRGGVAKQGVEGRGTTEGLSAGREGSC